MPIYEYECVECGTRFDKFVRSATRPVEVACPTCKSENCRKVVSAFASTGVQSSGANCAPSGG